MTNGSPPGPDPGHDHDQDDHSHDHNPPVPEEELDGCGVVATKLTADTELPASKGGMG